MHSFGRLTEYHEGLKVAQLLLGYRLHLGQESFANDQDASPRIVQDVFIFRRLEQGIDGNGNGADLDPAKEAVDKLRRIEEQNADPLFLSHTQPFERMAGPIDALKELPVGDPLI